jgi:hypothetical protein
MRIGASGNIWAGNTADLTSSANRLSIQGSRCIDAKSTGDATNPTVTFWNEAASGDNIFASLRTDSGGTERGTIDYNRAAGQVRYNVTSDARLKSDVVDAPSALPVLNQIQVRSYNWKETQYHVRYGFIAQELFEVEPDAVKAGDSGDEIAEVWSVDPSKLVPLLTAALQEALQKIDDLEDRLTAAGI